jgi:hypothetical protein
VKPLSEKEIIGFQFLLLINFLCFFSKVFVSVVLMIISAYSKREGERIGLAATEEDYKMVEQLQSQVFSYFISFGKKIVCCLKVCKADEKNFV